MNALPRLAAIAATVAILVGCATTSLHESATRTGQRVTERTGLSPAWPPGDTTAARLPAAPLDLEGALRLAFARNPEIRRLYARIGIAQADVESAARISNPRLSFAWLDPAAGGRDKTVYGITASFADLLLLPSRRRFSAAELERTELDVAAALLALAKDVEVAWYTDVGTRLAADRRESAASAAESAAELAARYRDAGNITQGDLDAIRLQAADARVAALAAQSRAIEARARLGTLVGLRTTADWKTTGELPAPPEAPLVADGLAGHAAGARFDLAAASLEVKATEDALAATKHRRLLGAAEAGYERERETDGSKVTGPTVAFEVPLFDQGQGPIARAEARALDARARRDALALEIENGVSAAAARLELARGVADQAYRIGLPAALSALERARERTSFMLADPFAEKRIERGRWEVEAGWLESVRDYWIARAELRALAGGALPGDDEARPPARLPELPEPAMPAGHEHHGDAP